MTCRGLRANGTLARRLLSVTATGWQPTSQRNCRAFWNCQRQEIWYTFSIRNTLLRQKGCFMAQKVQVLLVDDLDGSEATETVAFGLDGAAYEIDLSSGNAGKLRKELAHYVEHARKASSPARRRRARTGPGRERSAQIRAWAKQRGYKVNERGRIPANIVAEYEAAH